MRIVLEEHKQEDQKICTPDGTYNSVFHPVLSKIESSLHLPVECIKNNDRLIMDSENQIIIINPDNIELKYYKKLFKSV